VIFGVFLWIIFQKNLLVPVANLLNLSRSQQLKISKCRKLLNRMLSQTLFSTIDWQFTFTVQIGTMQYCCHYHIVAPPMFRGLNPHSGIWKKVGQIWFRAILHKTVPYRDNYAHCYHCFYSYHLKIKLSIRLGGHVAYLTVDRVQRYIDVELVVD
jgi:hypothetical protein